MHVNTYLESCRPRCCCCLLCSCRVMLRHRKQPALLSALNHAPRVCLPCVYHLLKLRKLSHPRDLTSYLPYALQSITVVLYTGYNRARMDATGTAARHSHRRAARHSHRKSRRHTGSYHHGRGGKSSCGESGHQTRHFLILNALYDALRRVYGRLRPLGLQIGSALRQEARPQWRPTLRRRHPPSGHSLCCDLLTSRRHLKGQLSPNRLLRRVPRGRLR